MTVSSMVQSAASGDSPAGHAVVTTAIGTAVATLAAFALKQYGNVDMSIVEVGAMAVVFSWITSLVGQKAAS